MLELLLNREILRYHVSQQMFCQSCQSVLDVREAVSVDIFEDGRLAVTFALCFACWDKQKADVGAALSRKGGLLTIGVIDGREIHKEDRDDE